MTLTFFHCAVSSYLNSDKHVCLGRRARKNLQINTLQDLETALTQKWQALPNALIQQYVNSMRLRIMAIKRSQRGLLIFLLFNRY